MNRACAIADTVRKGFATAREGSTAATANGNRSARVPCRAERPAFTLIEAIAAVVILGLAIPPMLWAVQEAEAHRLTPLMVTTARWLAAEKIEDVIADRFSPTRGYNYIIVANYPVEASVASFPAFRRTVAITETGPDLVTPGTGYKNITVQVTWTDAMHASRSLSIKTVLTKYNP